MQDRRGLRNPPSYWPAPHHRSHSQRPRKEAEARTRRFRPPERYLDHSGAALTTQPVSATTPAGWFEVVEPLLGFAGNLAQRILFVALVRRADIDPTDLVAADWGQLHRQLDRYVDVGLTKFVIQQADKSRTSELLQRCTVAVERLGDLPVVLI